MVVGGKSATAAVFTNSVVIDLSLATITNDGSGGQLISGNVMTLVPATAFTPVVGDTLVTTITFANGDRLRVNNGPNVISSILGQPGPDYFDSLTFYYDGTGSHSTNTTMVTFAGLQGSVSATPGGTSNGVLAQALTDFTASYASFTGLTMTTTITALPNPGVQSYSQYGLWGGRAGSFEVISAAVPEPASVILWGVGAVGVGLGMRWRRNGKIAAHA
jgi:hypothetical protein